MATSSDRALATARRDRLPLDVTARTAGGPLRRLRLRLERAGELHLAGYLAAVSLAALPVVAVAVSGLRTPTFTAAAPAVVLLSVLTVISELVPVRVARGRQAGDEISLSSAFCVALLLVAPLGLAILVQATALVLDEALRRGRWGRLPFNIAQYALSLAAARAVIAGCGYGEQPPTDGSHGRYVLAFLAAGLCFFVLNSGLTGIAVALKLHVPIAQQLLDDLRWDTVVALPLIGLAPAVVVVAAWSPWALVLLMAPVGAIHRSGQVAVQREHEALHDALTGLPNRKLLTSTTDRLVAAARSCPVALLLLDLDHFKEINDTLGHQLGDEVLRQVADRLTDEIADSSVGRGDDSGLVARLGGDEFAILVPAPLGTAGAVALADRLVTALAAPFAIGGLLLDVCGSIGVGLAPLHAERSEELMRVADVALYRAKESRGTAALYDRASDQHSLTRLALHSDLRQAVDGGAPAGGITLEYQPQLDAAGVVVSVEALARWRHPELGDISPQVFIPIAESTGLIDSLTRQVLTAGCEQLLRWRQAGLHVSLAVNLSARQLSDVRLPDLVVEVLRTFGIPPAQLLLEVTEGSVMSDPSRGAAILDRLHRIGVQLSIDDYGTGYSSLSYLTRLAVDELKVDRSFVADLLSSTGNQAIVRSTIELAHTLGLRVTAEGVEDATTANLLLDWGCDRLQGFAIGAPMPGEAFLGWEQGRHANTTINLVAPLLDLPRPRLS